MNVAERFIEKFQSNHIIRTIVSTYIYDTDT